jgi:hemerythrin-like metal-binding protein
MAGYFEWLDSYSVGIAAVAEDHKVLVSLVNEVVIAIGEHQCRELMNDTLSRLLEYASYHFDREEEVMEEHDFPGLEKHRALHDLLIRKVLRFLLRYRRGELDPLELGEFLIDWLTTHILQEDMKLGAHVRLRGVA